MKRRLPDEDFTKYKGLFLTTRKSNVSCFRNCRKMLRQNPMGDLDLYPMKILTEVMPGGIERDPDGEEYISYFLTKPVSELREKGII